MLLCSETIRTKLNMQQHVRGHAGGLATLLEKKSRRMELALYCSSHAIMSFALCLVRPRREGAHP